MLSIITSTYKPENFERFSESVQNSVGVEFEIIPIQNKGAMGLCQAYNKGLALAKFPFVCFCHDDIIFRTENWGQIIVDFFHNNPSFGLLGVAGGTYKPWCPSSWFFPDGRFFRANIIQVEKNFEKERFFFNPFQKKFDQVVILDGCWLCTTKDVATQIQFDEATFKGFHGYDIDYSLQVGSKYDLAVTYEVDIEHFSHGDFSKDWLVQSIILHRKWRRLLPRYIDKLKDVDIAENEFRTFEYVLDIAKKYNCCFKDLARILYSLSFYRLIGFRRWIKLNKYFMNTAINKIFR